MGVILPNKHQLFLSLTLETKKEKKNTETDSNGSNFIFYVSVYWIISEDVPP